MSKSNYNSVKNAIVFDIEILSRNFPWLSKFTDLMLRDRYLELGYAPTEILVPKEFLSAPVLNCKLNSNPVSAQTLESRNNKSDSEMQIQRIDLEKKELIDRICAAFRRNRYTFYQQYSYILKRYAERSLYALPIEELRKILLEIVNNTLIIDA